MSRDAGAKSLPDASRNGGLALRIASYACSAASCACFSFCSRPVRCCWRFGRKAFATFQQRQLSFEISDSGARSKIAFAQRGRLARRQPCEQIAPGGVDLIDQRTCLGSLHGLESCGQIVQRVLPGDHHLEGRTELGKAHSALPFGAGEPGALLFSQPHRFPQVGHCLAFPLLKPFQRGSVHVAVVASRRGGAGTLPNGNRPIYERFRLRVLAFGPIEPAEIVEHDGHVRMIWTEALLADCQCPAKQHFGLGILPLRFLQECQIVEKFGHPRMFGAQALFLNSQGSFIERLGLCEISFAFVQQRQVIESQRHVGMIGTETSFLNLQGPLKKRFRFSKLPLIQIQSGEVVKSGGDFGTIGTDVFFTNLQRALQQRFGFGILTSRVVKDRQVVKRVGDRSVVGPQALFSRLQHLLKKRFGGGRVAEREEKNAQAIERRGHERVPDAEVLLPNPQGASIERLDFGVPPHRIVKHTQRDK